jgi:hypothetical protein
MVGGTHACLLRKARSPSYLSHHHSPHQVFAMTSNLLYKTHDLPFPEHITRNSEFPQTSSLVFITPAQPVLTQRSSHRTSDRERRSHGSASDLLRWLSASVRALLLSFHSMEGQSYFGPAGARVRQGYTLLSVLLEGGWCCRVCVLVWMVSGWMDRCGVNGKQYH